MKSKKIIENRGKSVKIDEKIDENRCTVVQNHSKLLKIVAPVRLPFRPPIRLRPPVRLSARAGAGRTSIYKTPDRPPWAAVTHNYPSNKP